MVDPTSRDLKQGVEFGMITEARLDFWQHRFAITVYVYKESTIAVHRISFDGIRKFDWMNGARADWEKVELTQIELDRVIGSDDVQVIIDLWDVAELIIRCARVDWNGVAVRPD